MKHNWEYKKLGDISKIASGKSIEARHIKSEYHEGLYYCYGGNGVRGFVDKFSYEGMYPIIGRVGALCGNVHLAEGRFYATEHALVVRILQNTNPYWLTFQLKALNLRSIAKGVAQPVISAKEVSSISIPVPPLPIQQQIVDELDKLSEIIEKKKQQVKELDNLAQAIFYDMFGDPVENEKGWEVKTMGDIGTLQRGSGLSKKVLVEDGYPCILYGQIHTRFGAYTKKHLFCIPNELVHTAKIAHPNDLIMAITSEDVEGSCKSTAWLGDYDIAVGSDAAIFSHNQNSIYVSYYTKTKAFYNEKEKYARGFKVTHISTKEIATIPILLPPLPLQQSFAQKIEAIEKQKELINQSIKETQLLFDSRMDYYFGE